MSGAFPPLEIYCVNERAAIEFATWLNETGHTFDRFGPEVHIFELDPDGALSMVDDAMIHGWATSATVDTALAAYRRAWGV